jgi:hypothetical protein
LKFWRTGSLAALVSLFDTGSATARIDDTQLWTTMSVTAVVSGPFFVTGDVVLRFADNVSDYSQSVLTGGLGYAISNRVSVSAGLRRQRRHPATADDLDAVFEQVQWTIVDTPGVRLVSATRLEQMWNDAGEDTSWRLRPSLRLTTPLTSDGKLSAFFGTAVYFQLRDTDWGAESGFDQIRLSAGLQLPVTKHVTFEAGYLNRYLKRSPEDRMDNVGTIAVTGRF